MLYLGENNLRIEYFIEIEDGRVMFVMVEINLGIMIGNNSRNNLQRKFILIVSNQADKFNVLYNPISSFFKVTI